METVGELISKEYTKAKTCMKFAEIQSISLLSRYDSLVNKPQWCPYCCGRKGNFEEEIKHVYKI